MGVIIFTMTHRKFKKPADPIYMPLHVGRAGAADYGYAGDDTGDSISEKNRYYGELTGVYWVWKNVRTTDYVGVCHYRRYFCTEEGRIFNERDYLSILQDYDIITSKRLKLNYSYYDGYASDHNIFDLETTGEVIKELYPEYHETFERLVHGRGTYFGNMMVADKALYDEYAQWLFTIFAEVEKRIDPSGYDDYHKRVFGFISEFLLYVWVQVRGLRVYECKIGMTTEKYETGRMKETLADYFSRGDVEGAKTYFLDVLERRPDVLMEASDITGELKLSMQVIAVCDLERDAYGTCVLDRIRDFDALMRYFTRLNEIVSGCAAYGGEGNRNRTYGVRTEAGETGSGTAEESIRPGEDDVRFLRENQVSDVAIEASARLFITDEEQLQSVVEQIRRSR